MKVRTLVHKERHKMTGHRTKGHTRILNRKQVETISGNEHTEDKVQKLMRLQNKTGMNEQVPNMTGFLLSF